MSLTTLLPSVDVKALNQQSSPLGVSSDLLPWLLYRQQHREQHASTMLYRFKASQEACIVAFSLEIRQRKWLSPRLQFQKKVIIIIIAADLTLLTKCFCEGDTYTLGGQPTLHWQLPVQLCQFHPNLLAHKVSRTRCLPSHYYFVPMPRELNKVRILISLK